MEETLDFADNVRLGMENADYQTIRSLSEWLGVTVTVKGGRL